MKILQLTDIEKIYGSGELAVHALKKVNLSFEEGYFYSIIGKSGSGKSTLMHILGALDKTTSGEYLLDGINVFSLSDEEISLIRRRKIGFVFQSFNLLPEFTVRENILMPANLDNVKVDETYLKEITDVLGISEKLDYYPNELSGGQIQRVSIARALINKPAIILADEPTGNLDEKSGKDVLNLLKEFKDRYKQTIIMVTHDLDIAREADRVVTIRDGYVSLKE